MEIIVSFRNYQYFLDLKYIVASLTSNLKLEIIGQSLTIVSELSTIKVNSSAKVKVSSNSKIEFDKSRSQRKSA